MKLKKKITAILATLGLTAFAAFAMTGTASAAGETASVGFKLDPRGGTFFKDAYKPGNLSIETSINVPPGSSTIEPMKQANLQLPGSNNVTFNIDPKMPVCPDSAVNATTVSVPVETIVAACPKSIIGNGTAQFALAQQTALARGGVIILFNGGKQASGPLKDQPRIKLYAYSYDTEVGLYTEAALAKDGSLDFPVPVLTADSAVTSINLNIPGVPTSIDFPAKGITANLPAGQSPNYVQAKCTGSSFAFSGEFLLGDRPEGLPPGPTTTLTDSTSYACTGAAGKANFAGLRIKGPGKVKRGKKVTYKVKVKNNGTATARKGKLVVSGKGVKGKVTFGNLAAGKTKTVKVKVKFTKKGKVKAAFKATAAKTKAKTGKKTVKVQ